jgi:hypothetical protein
MDKHRTAVAAALFLLIAGCVPAASPQPSSNPSAQTSAEASPSAVADAFISFDDFLKLTRDATYAEFAGLEDTRVRDEEAFEAMRDHILNMYDGAQVASSFAVDGQYFDCVTIETQPSVRLGSIQEIASAPVGSEADAVAGGEAPGVPNALTSPLQEGLTDRYGNRIDCEDGTIPMARITLERLVGFETLEFFFSKDGAGGGALPPADQLPESDSVVHKYAHARQTVTNFGGNSWLNLWNPQVADHDHFSLAQQWYVGGSGTSTQTVEGGWQVYNGKYGDDNARLFTFWTAKNYVKSGCYNLDCAGFVQINSHWYLGGPWTHYSSRSESQWGFEMQWKLYRGNWWLFLKGPGSYEAVGYYPTSQYNGGQLSISADSIDYGGEVTGTASWPEMGSGQFADQGWQQAAFQNTIFSIPRDEDDGVGVWANLTAVQNSPKCYTIDLVSAADGGDWGTYFFFGGPGGTTCE